MQQTAAGFAEVHAEFETIDTKFGSLSTESASVKETVERVQQAEIERADRQETTIQKIRKNLRAV